jgi:hypothetical protein
MDVMKKYTNKFINTPANEFPEKKQELFNLYLKMPVQFKADWKLFRKRCVKQGFEFEDVLGHLIIQFNKGKISFKCKLKAHGQKKK